MTRDRASFGPVIAAVALLACMGAAEEPAVRVVLTAGGTPAAQGGVTLLVPRAYGVEGGGAAERPVVGVRMALAGFGPMPAADARCAVQACGGEVRVMLQAVAGPPAALGPGTLQEQLAARTGAGGMTLESRPVPPGFEEAIRASTPGPPGRAYMAQDMLFLVYTDGGGQRQGGFCQLGSPAVTCGFKAFDAATGLGITYFVPLDSVGERQAIEDGVRGVVAGWVQR